MRPGLRIGLTKIARLGQAKADLPPIAGIGTNMLRDSRIVASIGDSPANLKKSKLKFDFRKGRPTESVELGDKESSGKFGLLGKAFETKDTQYKSVVPADLNDPWMERSGGKELVKSIIRDHDEAYKLGKIPRLADYKRRYQPVSLMAPASMSLYAGNTKDGFIGISPDSFEDSMSNTIRRLNGLPLTGTLEQRILDILGHEGTHAYTKTPNLPGHQLTLSPWEPGSYITHNDNEYVQGALGGLLLLRHLTGDAVRDPTTVHQLFNSIEAKPSIIDKMNSISMEKTRLFRTYLYLKDRNPEAALRLREGVAGIANWLTNTQRSGGPRFANYA